MQHPSDDPSMDTPRSPWPRRVVVAAGVYAILVGAATLTGWAADLPRLADWKGHGIYMYPNTAVCAVLCGLGLLLAGRKSRVAAAMSMLAALIAGATFSQHVTGANLGIDTLLFSRDFGNRAAASPMRMGPPAGLCFTISGAMIALVALRVRPAPAAWIGGMVVSAVAMLSLMGYLFSASWLYELPHLTGISMQTSTVLLMLGLGVIAAVPWAGPTRTLTGDSAAARLLRRAVPVLVLLPVALGWLEVIGQKWGLYDWTFGAALGTLIEIALLLALAWWIAAAVRLHENRLTQTAGRLEGLLQSITESFQTLDSEMRFTSHNAAIRRLLARHGVDADATLGRNLFEVWPDLEGTEFGAALRRCMAERAEVAIDTYFAPWNRWFAVRVSPTPDGGLSILSLDITERKHAEAELHDSQRQLARKLEMSKQLQAVSSKLLGPGAAEELYGEILDAAIAVMRSQFASLQIVAVSPEHNGELHLIASRGFTPAAVKELEWVRPTSECIYGKTLASGQAALIPDVRECDSLENWGLETLLATGIIAVQSTPLRSRSGELLGVISAYWNHPHAPDETSLRGMDILARETADLIERTRHQRELERLVEARTAEAARAEAGIRRAQHLASLGTLAAGLGHDLANLMLPLRAHLSTLATRALDSQAHEDVANINHVVGYLRHLTEGLRQMAADPDAPPPPDGTDLRKWSEESSGIFKALAPRGTVVEFQVPPGLPRVNTAVAALTQAAFNLVQNAAEALAHSPTRGAGGLIRIEAVLSPSHEGWVEITVTDNGPGMTPEVVDRCFEPYYSTKGRAVSTGMGLSLVRGIADAAGGSVDCSSTPGQGCVFTLHLPPARNAARARATAVMDIAEPRMASVIRAVLGSLEVEVKSGTGAIPVEAELWVTDCHDHADIKGYIEGDAGRDEIKSSPGAIRRAVVVGPGADLSAFGGLAVHTGEKPSVREVRAAIKRVLTYVPGGDNTVGS